MNLQGKNALVTGASRGIGRAIAIQLAKRGANVAINYSSNDDAALEVKALVEAEGVKAILLKGSVGDFDTCNTMVEQTIADFGSIDILVNNAGIARDTLMLRMTEEQFDEVINVNLKGTWSMIKAAARPMTKQRNGRIINLSSVVALIGNFGQSNYVASKAGVIGMTKSLAKEFGPKGVTVNAVAPGFITTDLTDNLPEAIKEEYMKKIPVGYFGEADDIAATVCFLASEEARYITGETISVNGGMV